MKYTGCFVVNYKATKFVVERFINESFPVLLLYIKKYLKRGNLTETNEKDPKSSKSNKSYTDKIAKNRLEGLMP